MNTENNLRQEVELITEEVKRTHRYSMSRIYDLYNRVFSKDEPPQSCASCLIRKVRELNQWLECQKGSDVKANTCSKKKKKK